MCGNHDVGNRPNAVTIEEYRRDFGDDYFAFWVDGCRCLVVNTNLYNDPQDAEKEVWTIPSPCPPLPPGLGDWSSE